MRALSGSCEIKAGFLFRHGCDMPAESTCGGCGKSMCTEHARDGDDGPLCVRCIASTGDEGEGDVDESYVDEPYYYRGFYRSYGAYGHDGFGSDIDDGDFDHDDFTEADGMALGPEGDAGFEEDMDGS
jgi:hypothetical protein